MTAPRILHLDVETAPAQYYVWNPYQRSPLPIGMMIKPGRMIMWGAKWHGSERVIQCDERRGQRTMFQRLHALLSKADMVVTYNGDNFDLPWINGGIVLHRLPPLPPVPSLDLYKTVRRLRYQSSKLAYISPLLGIGEKVKNAGMDLWIGVEAGERKSWQEMKEYNRGDVLLLDAGYNRLRPYIKSHPVLFASPKNRLTCPHCGGKHLQSRGHRVTLRMRIERWQCLSCGRWPPVGKREVVR